MLLTNTPSLAIRAQRTVKPQISACTEHSKRMQGRLGLLYLRSCVVGQQWRRCCGSGLGWRWLRSLVGLVPYPKAGVAQARKRCLGGDVGHVHAIAHLQSSCSYALWTPGFECASGPPVFDSLQSPAPSEAPSDAFPWSIVLSSTCQQRTAEHG